MTRGIVRIAVGLGLAYAAVCALAFVLQRHLIYFPKSSSPPLPSGEGWRGFEEVEITTSDGIRLEAWFREGPAGFTVAYFHGNAGNRGGWRAHAMRDIGARTGASVCLVDYRGYGGSGGSPSEEGLYLDAEATVDWIEARGEGPIVYWGTSLGSGVATELALRRPPAALVLQSPFLSVAAVAKRSYPFLPIDLLLRDRFDNEAKIGRVEAPLFVVHGDVDTLTPIGHGRALVAAAGGPAEILVAVGSGHNDVWRGAGEELWVRLEAFLGAHARP